MKQFVTQDIYLAASLIALGASLYDMDARDSRHQKFILEADSDFEFSELSDQFYRKRLLVEATSYREALRQLKAAIHASRD